MSRESAVGRNGVEREGEKKETRSRSGRIGEARRVKEEDFHFRGPLRACQALISVDSFDSRFISVRVRVYICVALKISVLLICQQSLQTCVPRYAPRAR